MTNEPSDGGHARQWDDHWSRYSTATRLNPAQAFRRRLIATLLGQVQHGSILDVGCGSGDLLAWLKMRFPNARFAGIDQSVTGLKVAEEDLPNAIFAVCDLEADAPDVDNLAGWASHAICSEVLEHADNPVRILTGARKFLKPGGRLVVTVPGGPMSAFDRQIGHRRHYTAAKLQAEMEQAGLDVRKATGAGFPFFNLYRLVVILRGERLADDIDGTPGLLARCIMAMFRILLGFTFLHGTWGWQIAAVGINPVEPSQAKTP